MDVLIFLFVACITEPADEEVINTAPEIAIFFPSAEGEGEVDEGEVLFKALATDQDEKDQAGLTVRWMLDESQEPICSEAVLDEHGETRCTVAIGLSSQKVIAEVQDQHGAIASDEYLLTVQENQPPTIDILHPFATAAYGDYRQDIPFSFTAQVFDPNESPRNLLVEWQSSSIGDLGITATASVAGIFTDEAILPEGEHLITATVTDSLGSQTSTSIVIVVGPQGIPEIEYVYVQNEAEVQLEEAFDTQTLTCIVSAIDPYEEDLTYSYQWFNQAGDEITADTDSTQITLNYVEHNLSGGEEVHCQANVHDSEFTVSAQASVTLLPCSPLNTEIPYDGLDSNCDGLEFLNDQNRDGIPDNGAEDFHDSAANPARLGVECYGEQQTSGLVSVYYLICDSSFHWQKSQNFCVENGYDSLATMHTQEEFDGFSSMLSSHTSYIDPDGTPRLSRSWVGLTRGPDCFPAATTGTGFPSLCSSTITDYYWIDGGVGAYVNPNHWWNGEGTDDVEHCAELYWENGAVGFSDLYCDVAWLQPHYTPSLEHTRPVSCMKRWSSAN